ncbi:MAG: TIGR03936 family radical SAM-associated protein [Acidimicrobiia bacterium]
MRVRLMYAKAGKIRFSSHRDMARCWERALRRAGLPVASTEGFSPRPKLHFGLALSTGHESDGEFLDVDLREPEGDSVVVDSLPELLSPLLPVGVDVLAAAVVDRSETSLQEAVTSCTWLLEVPGETPESLADAVESLLSRSTIPFARERKGRTTTDDLRPGILDLRVLGATPADAPESGALLEAELATQPRSVRPAELLAAFDPPRREGRVRRTHQWIMSDGAKREPTPATSRVPVGAR